MTREEIVSTLQAKLDHANGKGLMIKWELARDTIALLKLGEAFRALPVEKK